MVDFPQPEVMADPEIRMFADAASAFFTIYGGSNGIMKVLIAPTL